MSPVPSFAGALTIAAMTLASQAQSAFAAAPTTTLTAVADAYVDASAPKQRFGGALELRVGSSPTRIAYVRFDLTAVAPPIVRATLQVQAGTSSLSGVDVRSVADGNWNERSISSQNAPAIGSGVAASPGPMVPGTRSVDITSLVTAGRPSTVALTSSATSPLSFASRETGTPPRLVIETADLAVPAVTLTTPAAGSMTNQSQPSFGGAAGTAAGDSPTVTVNVYGGTAASGTPLQTLTTTAAGGAWSVTANAALAEGVYTAQAQQADDEGNVGRSSANTFTVDTTPPSGDYRSAVSSDAPRAYWRLDETSGLTAADQTSSGISGSYLNGVVLGRPGAIGQDPNTAIALDGANDTVRFPNAAALNSSGAMSVEAWIRPASLPATTATIARKESQYLLRLSGDGAVTFRLWKGGAIAEAVTPGGAVSAGAWAHVVATWDGATMRVYVNGAVRASRTLSAPADLTTQDLYLGSSYNSYDFYAGAIDEVAVYAAALPATRVSAHYSAAGGTSTSSVTLLAPAAGSLMDAMPNFGGAATSGAGAVTVRVYSGTSASGTPVQSIAAAVQPAGTFSARATALGSGAYTAVAEQSDGAGGVARSQPSTFTIDADADPSVLAAGDIAACDTFGDEATAALLDRLPGTVHSIGDHVYERATASDFTNCYDPTWGRHKARTRPSIGDHEYLTTGAVPYFSYFGAAAGDPAKGYQSYDIGTWHVVSLNGVCAEIGGCGAGSPEEQWLRADLAAHPAACTLAILHKPRFSSGAIHGSSATYQPFWQALYDFGVELVLSGDDHVYERFAKQTPTGVADPARGIREIIAGTGGRSHYQFGTIQPNSEVRNNDAFGVLQVTLHPGSYAWRFVPEAGRTFSDAGTASCH